MCAVLRLWGVRTSITELKEAEKELAREVAEEVMGPGVKEIIVQDAADQGRAIIAYRNTDDPCAPIDVRLKKLQIVRSRACLETTTPDESELKGAREAISEIVKEIQDFSGHPVLGEQLAADAIERLTKIVQPSN